LGAYGNEWSWTRAFDRLAARGVVFDQHFATTTESLQADSAWCAGDPDIIHKLNKAGVYTVRIRDQADIPSPSGWVDDRLADELPQPATLLAVRAKTYEALEKLPGNSPALLWIDIDPVKAPWRPANKWLKYYFDASEGEEEEPIEPWLGSIPTSVPEDEDDPYERLQTTYAAIISTLDGGLARLLAGCRQRGFGTNGLTILTSALSEPLGENSIIGRQSTAIVESVVHLPLIIRLPENVHAGRHVTELTQPGDVGATLANYFDVNAPNGAVSLLPSASAEAHPVRTHLLIQAPSEQAVRTAQHLFVMPRRGPIEAARLYLKPEDRWEYNDLAAKNEVDVEQLAGLLSPRRPGEAPPAQ